MADGAVDETPVAAGEATTVDETKEKESREPPKKVDKPDERAFNERMEKLNADIKKNQDIVDEARRVLDGKGLSKGNMSPEQLAIKNKLDEYRNQGKALIEERNKITEKISQVNDVMKAQTANSRELKNKLSNYNSVESIEDAINQMTFTLQTSSVTLKREKEIMADIEKLRMSKGLVKTYADQEAQIKATKEASKALNDQFKAKNAELSAVKDLERKQKEALDKIRNANQEKRSDVPALLKQKDDARTKIDELRKEMRSARDEYHNADREYQKYARYLLRQKQDERRKQMQAEWESRRAEREAYYQEVLDMPAWTAETAVIDNLKIYLDKFRPKTEEQKAADAAAEAARAVIPEGDGKGSFSKKVKNDHVELDGMYAGFGGKGKKAPKAKAEKVDDGNLRHSMDVLASFEKLKLKAPLKREDVDEALRALEEKREWFAARPDEDPAKKAIRAKMEKEKAEVENRDAEREKEREARNAERSKEREAQQAERDKQRKERDATREAERAKRGPKTDKAPAPAAAAAVAVEAQ